MELLVGGTPGPERELVDPVAGETRMGMAIDESRNRRKPSTVDFIHAGNVRRQIAHRADRLDPAVAAEDERVLDDPDVAETSPS